MKTKRYVKIISMDRLTNDIISMWIEDREGTQDAWAGRFVSLYCRDKSRLLPRPISICEIDEKQSRMRLVFRIAGQGTAEFATYKPGDTIGMVGPLGNGFPPSKEKAILIGGGIGIPPMLQLAKTLGSQSSIVLGYRDAKTFLLDEFEGLGDVYVATEDGSVGTKGNVIHAITENAVEGTVIYACGPLPMLKGIQEYAKLHSITAWLSLEERMACGIGACLACVMKSTEEDSHSLVKNKRICKDGPVFLATEVDFS